MGSVKFTLADYVTNTDKTNIQKLAYQFVADDTINDVNIMDKDHKVIASAKNKKQSVHDSTKKLYVIKKDVIKLGQEKK